MNVLFISISSLPHVSEHGISLDLIREFRRHGHNVYIICALEKRENQETNIKEENGCKILRVRIGNNKRANVIEKGITTIFLPEKFIAAIKEYYADIKFDLVLYPTPPVTQVETVRYIKKRDGAKTYLLLKDIFPQNAVDLGMMSLSGLKSIIYRYFRNKEKQLYRVSDRIGCMSAANVEYVLDHNPEVKERNDREKRKSGKSIIEVCPNCIEPIDTSISEKERIEIRKKYNIPLYKTVFIYGGNLGKPQGIEFMLKCLHSQRENDSAFFLIVGNGTEYGRIEEYVEKYKPKNMALYQWLTREEYDKFSAACDVGMIFLDHRFTIPNFPSRLLAYMQAKLPVLAVTDTTTDIGKVIVENGFGWWCGSDDVEFFIGKLLEIMSSQISIHGETGYQYLLKNYSVRNEYEIIMRDVG